MLKMVIHCILLSDNQDSQLCQEMQEVKVCIVNLCGSVNQLKFLN